MYNALTIDLEDYFHVSNFENRIARTNWRYLPIRIEENTRALLNILSLYHVRATFFVLGWVAERMGALIREIRDAGHEIASHGYEHRLAFDMSPEEFRWDVRRSKDAIEGEIGEKIYGYRATSYSIVQRNVRFLQILAEEGFTYDSSIFPIHHDCYGIPYWHRFPKMVYGTEFNIYEMPPSTIKILGNNLPIAGGGYLRLFPIKFLSYCIRHINKREGKPTVLYIHPWELDTGQPRIKVSLVKGFRHYNNIQNTGQKLEYLLKRFKFCPMCELIPCQE